jgi:alanine dehydrogenase
MTMRLKVGILRETKDPPDKRVALTPHQVARLKEDYRDVEFFVQPGDDRCYTNEEYSSLNVTLKEDLSDCDILMGVKEVDKEALIQNKTYVFFAHVAKMQPYNQEMFKVIADKKITLIDYEYLTVGSGQRVVAFGRYAGIVGAYNGLRNNGIKTGKYNLTPAYQCHDLAEMWAGLNNIKLEPGLKILITGNGRVANGAAETLIAGNIIQITPEEFLASDFNEPVFCQIKPEHYVRHKKELKFRYDHFVSDPKEYESAFLPFTKVSDILITGHYWDPKAPVFFTKEDMRSIDFRISVIADISCDINGPVPSTIRSTTISDPFYDYNPQLEIEEAALSRPTNISVMSIDNLPGELPRDASRDFGEQLIENVMPDLLTGLNSPVIDSAVILKKGKLTPAYAYLDDFLNE